VNTSGGERRDASADWRVQAELKEPIVNDPTFDQPVVSARYVNEATNICCTPPHASLSLGVGARSASIAHRERMKPREVAEPHLIHQVGHARHGEQIERLDNAVVERQPLARA
jgi:hypothetical protein